MTNINTNILPALRVTIDKLISQFDKISEERKSTLRELANLISSQSDAGEKILLNFICTHNSRRSHISQIWAQTAAYYYGVDGVETFSGGTEATAFNPRAVKAMQARGFDIAITKEGSNPLYNVKYAADASPMTVFSKRYDDEVNPHQGFAAIMTCSDADENCPIIFGSATRISLTYNDPKAFDGTPEELSKYIERVEEIGREILFAFSLVTKR